MMISDKINLILVIVQVIAMFAILGTLLVYALQLNTMRKQLYAMMSTNVRFQHNELVKLSLEYPEILEIWNSNHTDISPQDFKRHLFVNLSISNLKTLFDLDIITEKQLENELTHNCQNQYYKSFWSHTRELRLQSLSSSDTKARMFFEVCDRTFSTNAT